MAQDEKHDDPAAAASGPGPAHGAPRSESLDLRRARLEAELEGLLAAGKRHELAVSRLRQALREAAGSPLPVRPDLSSQLEAELRALAKTWMAVSEIFAELGRWEEGAGWARKVLDMAWDEESRADASLLLAVMLQRSDWYGEALEAFRSALDHGLDDPRLVAGANIGAADCLLSLGRASDAEVFCHAALGAEPGNATALYTLVRSLVGQGEWESAARCLMGACDREVPGAQLMLYGLMDHVRDIPDWDVLMPEVRALFDEYREKEARRAMGRTPDA